MDYFTSDLHLGHANALEFDSRPFSSLEEETREITLRWNSKVSPRDTVWILGDVIWTMEPDVAVKMLRRLNGKKYLISGNHDKAVCHEPISNVFEGVFDYKEITVRTKDGIRHTVVLSHYPILFYNKARREGIMLHGHLHGGQDHVSLQGVLKELNADGLRNKVYNVGCMHFDYTPVTLDEIIAHYEGE